jgi:hypothetical protein
VAHRFDLHRAADIAEAWPPTLGVSFRVHFTNQEVAIQFHCPHQFLCDRFQILNMIKGKGRQSKIKYGSSKGKLQTVCQHEAVTDFGLSSGDPEHGCREIESNHRPGTPRQQTGEPPPGTASEVKNITSHYVRKNAREMTFLQR